MENDILAKIKEIRPHARRIYTDGDRKVALALLKGEISYSQVAKHYGFSGSNVYHFFWSSMRDAYLKGDLIIKE